MREGEPGVRLLDGVAVETHGDGAGERRERVAQLRDGFVVDMAVAEVELLQVGKETDLEEDDEAVDGLVGEFDA